MANPLYEDTIFGTIGELLLQLRLLELGVQAAPPIRDSGNDLVAVRGKTVRFIQTKTTRRKSIYLPDKLKTKEYDILAIVKFDVLSDPIELDKATILLLRKSDISHLRQITINDHLLWRLSPELITRLWL